LLDLKFNFNKIENKKKIKDINETSKALILLGNCYMTKTNKDGEEIRKALDCFIKADKIDKQNLILKAKIGNLLYHQGEMDLSIKIYNKALLIDPDNLDIKINLGKRTFNMLIF